MFFLFITPCDLFPKPSVARADLLCSVSEIEAPFMSAANKRLGRPERSAVVIKYII